MCERVEYKNCIGVRGESKTLGLWRVDKCYIKVLAHRGKREGDGWLLGSFWRAAG